MRICFIGAKKEIQLRKREIRRFTIKTKQESSFEPELNLEKQFIMIKTLELTEKFALSTIQAIENPNVCKNPEMKVHFLRELIVQMQIEGVLHAIRTYGNYSCVSPAYAALISLRDDLIELKKTI